MNIFEANVAGKQMNGNLLLQDISISVKQGERIAIIGHNGSGKSSLLKLIGGIFEQSSGEIKRANIKTAYVPEHFPENICFKMQEYLLLMGKMSGSQGDELSKQITAYAKSFEIEEFLHTPLKNCSKGTKQKAGIIQALLMDPELLLLDEPLTGLDEQAQLELLNQLESKRGNNTIIFTVHESMLIDRLADRVLMIKNGRIVDDSVMTKKEKIMVIKAVISNQIQVSGLPCISFEWIEENIIEMMVLAEESNKLLKKLLEQDFLILELREKR
ncbi:ATP-binding cassette domain-containing protein [Cytobacillus dafuensis]|uniref:ATP-binding cassette domain-containing protein n=1 Tax=Cytobacillus dafuensis TaxID=1742359 RepID=A0A5B8Z7B0_CYTDA|nr:ATP-binding cassette domain-containing protein [Cytobacillus dafuensis]QED47266.1 ATP-binding cassette domain-containing protein [Cytobacillus dafuensis]